MTLQHTVTVTLSLIQYRRFIVLLERVLDHPLGGTEKEFLLQFCDKEAGSAEGIKIEQVCPI